MTRPAPADDEQADDPVRKPTPASLAYKAGEAVSSARAVPEETAVALTYDGATRR